MDFYRIHDLASELEKKYGANRPTREEFIAAASILEIKRRLRENPTLKPAEVLPCPLCGAKSTKRLRSKNPNGFIRYCKCGFAGYICPTDSKNGGRLLAAWNKAVLDLIDGTYQTPQCEEWLNYK